MQFLFETEQAVIAWLGWPEWAMRTVGVLTLLIGLFSLLSAESAAVSPSKPSKSFKLFRAQYLTVYLIIMCADWLQGTNMYTLYTSYDVDVGTLFLTGFLSSAIFGTFLGMYVDMWGRRFGCLLFCALEIAINLIEHIPSMPLLMVGRILGGMSTSLLFSAFESWMVSEHRKRGYSEEWLSGTFSICSWGNGVVAILAGFLAQISADFAGDIGPFQLAIILTIVAMLLIIYWDENYGDTHISSDNSDSSMFTSIKSTLSVVYKYPAVLCLGLSQSFFEGAVYTFVFMWVPSMLQLLLPDGQLPTGLVFSCFMLSMTLGGMLFALILPYFPGGVLSLAAVVYFVAATSMAVPVYKFEFWWVFISFLVLECLLGMFGSCGGTLRSIYYPEGMQSSIMSMFRLPLNILVVVGTVLANNANSVEELQQVYKVVVGMLMAAFGLQLCVMYLPVPETVSSNKKKQA